MIGLFTPFYSLSGQQPSNPEFLLPLTAGTNEVIAIQGHRSEPNSNYTSDLIQEEIISEPNEEENSDKITESMCLNINLCRGIFEGIGFV